MPTGADKVTGSVSLYLTFRGGDRVTLPNVQV